MARKEKEVTIGTTQDKWKVKTTRQGKFETATLNGEEMNRRSVGPDDEVDLGRMQEDADNFPKIPEGGVTKGNTYAYCLPIRNSKGVIIWWTCGGTGPYTC